LSILGLIAFLFVIARAYYRLANKYDRNPISFALIGAGIGAVCILISTVAGFFILFKYVESDRTFLAVILGLIGFCFASVVGSYQLLKRHFQKGTYKNQNPDILDM